MRNNALRLVVPLVVAGVLGLPLLAASPQQNPQPQQPPRIRAGANFVRVDAYPTKDGKPLLDLKETDFEVFEDGVLQKVEAFEHVVVRAGGAADRIEVPSQRESLQAAANPRNRVFVIFLDTGQVDLTSSRTITEPLIRLMSRILGPDDLIGIMTPNMAASQVVLGRKTQVLEEGLRNAWPWGMRDTLQRDEREMAYEACYPPLTQEKQSSSNLVNEMILRKRERATLDALEDLVGYLQSVREERKAIITVSQGWLLYRPNPALLKLREDSITGWKEPVPGLDPVGVGPNGKLTTHDTRKRDSGTLSKSQCDTDRMMLANMDNDKYFRDILDDANRANATFYPIDPRGLAVFDNAIGPAPPPPIAADMAMLRQRLEVLKTMADNTDGLAVVDTNDLDKGLRRISDDLSSYYLLGYSSTNTKLDGRFRSLKVRVKIPGVDVRARRGYRAANEADVLAARAAADAPVPEAKVAVTAAIDKLGRIRPNGRFYVNATTDAKGKVWVAGEIQSSSGRPDEFAQGATVNLDVSVGSGTTSATIPLKPGERTFATMVTVPGGGSGDLSVRARLTPPEGSSAPLTDAIRLEGGSASMQPLMLRRGATTGNRLVPAADFHFTRTERVRLEIPVSPEIKPGTGRVLDRLGQPLQVPVTVGERTDEASGQRWITADLTLGAMAAGDYGVEVELTGGSAPQKILTGIRIVAR